MTRKKLSKCNEEDVLAEDIINDFGVFILPSGTILTKYIMQKLSELGIESILVADRNKNDNPLNSIQAIGKKYKDCKEEIKNVILEIAKGKKVDLTSLNRITNLIMTECREPEHIIKCMGKIQETDDNTYYHSINVSLYSMLIAGWLGLSNNEVQLVVRAALLHDIGKTNISNELLNKKEKLSIKEFEEIKKHPIYGYNLLKADTQISEEIRDVILMHHEREDGSGYPLHAFSQDISIYTKIVTVADVYDAMTSKRPYKKALTPFDAFEEFFSVCIGSMDMSIVNTLLYNLSHYYTGSKVLLNNGETGNVAFIPPQCLWKPIVSIGSEFLDLSREEVFITRII